MHNTTVYKSNRDNTMTTTISSTKNAPASIRTTFNLLITGHTPERLGADGNDVLKVLDETLEAIQRALFSNYNQRRLRIWTGLSEGTDARAIAWAAHHAVPLYCVAATTTHIPQDVAEVVRQHARVLAITDEAAEKPNPLWVQASDEYKLSMADAVIAIWDGDKARGGAGGVVRILAESLRRRLPVVWIDMDCNCRLSTPFDPDVSSQVSLALLDPLVPETMTPLFGQPWRIANSTQENISRLITSPEPVQLNDLFANKDEPGEQPRLAGFWHTGFFRLLTPWRHHWKPRLRNRVTAYRGGEDFVRASDLNEQQFWQDLFDPLDRFSTHTANQYRDSIVLSHLLSSLAVLGAVAGVIHWLNLNGWVWGILELSVLIIIGILVRKGNPPGRRPLRDLFLETRRAAESFRLSALLYPFMASLPELHRELWQIKDIEETREKRIVLNRRADWLVIQALRDAEPPAAVKTSSANNASASPYLLNKQIASLRQHLLAFIDDQIKYHQNNAEKTETIFHRLHCMTRWVYFLVLGVVIAHILELSIEWVWHDEHNILMAFAHFLAEQKWLILITAFFPALAAALHGILSALELKRIAQASARTAEQLKQIKHSLQAIKPEEINPIILRAHAILTAQVTFAEHDQWNRLMNTQNLDIPA